MENNLNGLIEISITQEHIDACHAILKYQEDLQKQLDTYTVKSYLFGLIKIKKYPRIESTNPFVFTICWGRDWDYGEGGMAYTDQHFDSLYLSIRNCVGETIYLSLDNYDTLCAVMEYTKKE